jgi:acetolactate synthase I/II/III large subunit
MAQAHQGDMRRGADALVRTLESAGVRYLFTVSGNHIMPVFDAAFQSGMQLIHTRHEAAAVHMADAWARITGEVGIALVTGGPGHANAVSALYTALMAEAPVVLLSGHAPHDQLGKGAFQEMRQADLAAPVAKAAWTCAAPAAVAGEVAKALRIATSGRPGPVHLSLPVDVLEGAADSDAAQGFTAQGAVLEQQAAAALIAPLSRSSRPLILAGPACMTRAGRDLMAQLQAASGIPLVGMESPRGISDPSLGALAEVLSQADCVLLAGKRLDFTLRFGMSPPFAPGCTFLQVDSERAEIERSARALEKRLLFSATADAFPALCEMTRQAARYPKADPGWLQEVERAIGYRPSAWGEAAPGEPDRLHPVQALRPLQALLDSHRDSVLVCDGGEFGQWAQACLSAPHRVINGVAGSIGSALPYALAARCALSEAPVVAVTGDGSFGFHLAELDTAVRYRLPLVVVVGNDARWNAEYQIQLREYGPQRAIGCELLPARYDLVAAALGGYGERVSESSAMAPAIDRAFRSGLPACLNVMIEGLPAPVFARPAGAGTG